MAEECPECGSTNIIERYNEGDTFFKCKKCKYTVVNGVVILLSNKHKRKDK